MQRFHLAILFALAAASASARVPSPALAPLQDRWVVTGAEHNAEPLDAIKCGG